MVTNEHEPQKINVNNNSIYISWLEDRIKKSENEKDITDDMNIKISKGSKICAYKEMLNYIREHNK